jgi:hypothetical protein
MKTVQELAIQYAEALVAYHEISKKVENSSESSISEYAGVYAYNDLLVAQEELNHACEKQAEANLG